MLAFLLHIPFNLFKKEQLFELAADGVDIGFTLGYELLFIKYIVLFESYNFV